MFLAERFRSKRDFLSSCSVRVFHDLLKFQEANFTIQVWKRLCTINSGETVTYAELADLSGNAKASRAVGQAMRTNPVVLMVPCHRVIPKGYGVGNYACGRPKIKEWLIQHEKSVK